MKKHRDLVLVGGGGHCKSVIEAAESAGFRIHGVLDIPEHIGQTVLSGRIIGTDDDLADYVSEYDFVVTVGFIKNASLRLKKSGLPEDVLPLLSLLQPMFQNMHL